MQEKREQEVGSVGEKATKFSADLQGSPGLGFHLCHRHSQACSAPGTVLLSHNLSQILLRPLCLQGREINSWFSSLRKMDSDISQAFQKELTCLICLNYLMDPVTMGCGHSFCWSCLCVFWEKTGTPAQCPLCRQISQQTNFKINFILKNLVSIARKASLRQFLSSGENICGPHKETKRIFCEDDGCLLCPHCSSSQEHEAHRHCSVEEAAEEFRVSDALLKLGDRRVKRW